MRISKPSPAMVVACTALFVALGGTSIAAVNYAANAGKVDGKDARSARTTTSAAAGDLVATASRGPRKGQIPGRFVSEVARTVPFGRFLEVQDNATGAPIALVAERGFATVSVACNDQDERPGLENPAVVLTVANQSGGPVNLARRQGDGNPSVVEFANGTVQTFTVGAANTIEINVQKPSGQALLIDAGARKIGQGTAAGGCNLFGTALRVFP